MTPLLNITDGVYSGETNPSIKAGNFNSSRLLRQFGDFCCAARAIVALTFVGRVVFFVQCFIFSNFELGGIFFEKENILSISNNSDLQLFFPANL
jgi:hypothetical protein